ncbi:hypothetical protein [Rhodococcus sp. HNM0569]|uniref:Rv2732c family membrane protein n=1 Tax=Rhodococcus sp. HNM0569 TaxID=2716340 RepID=UPI00146DC697|nr:hypothetical protein [Rhodococcus sp. HNM0569]NLU82703.1 hypothetical protein [Rhodococcus sp. HNM0569]
MSSLDRAVLRDLARIERKVLGEIELGWRGRAVGAVSVVMAAALVLPQLGGLHVWELPGAGNAGLLAVVFTAFALAVGLVASPLAVLVRRWSIAWIAVAGSGVTTALGLFAYWSQHSAPQGAASVGPGLVIDWLGVAVLTVLWLPVVLQRLSRDHHRRSGARGRTAIPH